MSRDEIEAITDQCFDRHKTDIDASNAVHEKKIKKSILFGVTVPVGVLCMLCAFVLNSMFKVNSSVIKHQTETVNTISAQTSALKGEVEARKLSDTDILDKLDKIELKLDSDLKFLYQNVVFKSSANNIRYNPE